MPSPSVAVVIINWNSWDHIRICLESLRTDSYPNKTVVVVDNGSTDDSTAQVREGFPEVVICDAGSNLGFSGGNNVGIRYAIEKSFDYVLLLNNDVIANENLIQPLVDAVVVNPQLGGVSPLIYYTRAPGTVWFGGAKMDLGRGTAVHDNSYYAEHKSLYEVPWVSGCAVLIPTGVLEKIGGMDDRYFLYWEDVDLSVRIRDLGFELAIEPRSRLLHSCGMSVKKLSGASQYYYFRNNLLLVSTHVKKGRARAVLIVLMRGLRTALTRMKDNLKARDLKTAFRHLRFTRRALVDHFIRHRYGKMP